MEGLSPGLSTGSGTFTAHHLLLCDCAMRPDLSCIEANLCIAEDVALKHEISEDSNPPNVRTYREEIDKAHNNYYNSRSNDYPPECETKRFLTGCFLVQISQNRISKQNHCHTEHDKAGVSTEEGPVTSEVISEEGDLGENEEA
jgi:hypothetical protein